MAGPRARRPVAEIGVVGAEAFGSDGGGGGDHDVDGAEPEAEEWAVGFGQGVEGVVGFRADLGKVSEDGPAWRAWWEMWALGLVFLGKEKVVVVEEEEDKGGKEENKV